MFFSVSPVSRAARAVVTGAGSGIGRAFALELAARGGSVVCSDISADDAEHTAALIRSAGGSAFAVTCDVAQQSQVAELAVTATKLFGQPPNLLVNNAGVGAGGRPVGSIGPADWNWVLGINLFGVIHGCEVFAPILRQQRRAGIINIASAAGFNSAPVMGPYCVSKAGVISLSEVLAAEMVGSGVSVTVVCPTFVATNVARNGRIAQGPAEFAAKMVERGMDPEIVARKALEANDKGTLYVMPQFDAKVAWRAKRLAPALLTRGMSFAGKVMGAGDAD
ncbi:SDR family NAD(P)-dependent oxidoreductase [Nocardia flavorosea]|uniref:SDR family NAD(P)-dependent oxidoreductase n=1 Tax=Nocardia flavorosea TaxID=53429 RepID=A0A846YRW7_9NOCA|nr:SDR family NAD(P)-dependent oxidoreductase [Nocardia flavorosea]NKY60072.1 SDR family NAD(P)-dependent oxidoreductase [Nocardia flavorosea]